MKFIIASHVTYFGNGNENYGLSHELQKYLKKKRYEVLFIKHCLYGEYPSVVSNTLLRNCRKGDKKSLIIRTFNELIFDVSSSIKFKKSTKTNARTVYIGVDPINSIAGFILKVGKVIDKNIYYTADYADNRFNNSLVNFVYHFMDKLALYGADEVWCVSHRIMKKRKSQGVSSRKIKFLPNSPFASDLPKATESRNKNLIIVSSLTKSLSLEPILKVVRILSVRHKDIKLLIVGTGPQEGESKKLVDKMILKGKVLFLGQKKHDEVLNLMAKSFLGIALYTNEHNFNFYGDSMKVREYVACGLPVIINNIPSTADDIKKNKAGLVINRIDEKEMIAFIEKCLNDRDYYNYLSKNAKKMGIEFDKDKMLDQII
jgi:glycosyltransferase involved in cell wall biosynthesis